MGAFFGSLAFKILAPMLLAVIIGGGIYLRDLRIEKNAIIGAQRDQLAELAVRHAQEVSEKNKIWAAMLALPDGRTRLCAMQGPASGCCRPLPAECVP